MIVYFKTHYGVQMLGDITWAHAVNSKERLQKYLNKPETLCIESDILLAHDGTPIAAHPPRRESDLTLADLLSRFVTSKQGLKLDFKDPNALEPSLRLLKDMHLPQPVFLNADILEGPGGNVPEIDAEGFIALCRQVYPKGILSLGWTIGSGAKNGYSKKDIAAMLKLCKSMPDVTFPVKASLLPISWEALRHLVEKDGYSLSIYNKEPITEELQKWIETNTDPEKTMYDLVDGEQNPLLIR